MHREGSITQRGASCRRYDGKTPVRRRSAPTFPAVGLFVGRRLQVRGLEAQNRKLADELDKLKTKWGKETEQIKAMFQAELDEARAALDEAEKEKARLEIKVASLEEQIEELRVKSVISLYADTRLTSLCPRRRGGHFGIARSVRPSVLPSVCPMAQLPYAIGTLAAGILAMCRLWTDVDPPRVELPSTGGISSRRPRATTCMC